MFQILKFRFDINFNFNVVFLIKITVRAVYLLTVLLRGAKALASAKPTKGENFNVS